MSEMYSTISMVAYILAGVFLVGAIIVFFAANVRGAYIELRMQGDKNWAQKRLDKAQKNEEKKTEKTVKETATTPTKRESSRIDADGEAVTTLENGEEAGPSVYEASTTVEDLTEDDLEQTIPQKAQRSPAQEMTVEEETTTAVGDDSDGWGDGDFRITQRVISINTKELVTY